MIDKFIYLLKKVRIGNNVIIENKKKCYLGKMCLLKIIV